jgi:predicted dehydrogenase
MRKIRIAIIGSGFGQYGLLPAFLSTKNCEVVAICGKKRPQLLNYCKRIGFNNIYDDWQTLLKKEELDAVALAVTPRAQTTIAKAAIKKGLHIFAEKPLAANVLEARELLSLAQRKKITHGIDFLFPEIAEWKKAKELIDKKVFGKLTHISARWDFLSYDIKNKIKGWKTDTALGGGALSFYFSHGLYYLEHFAGEITGVKSSFAYSAASLNGGEVGVDMLLKFKSGIAGMAHICCDYQGLPKHQLILQCEKGVIILENGDGFVDNFTLKTSSEGIEKTIRVKKDGSRTDEDERVKVVKKLAARFVLACLEKKQMTPSFENGLRVQILIDKIRYEGM